MSAGTVTLVRRDTATKEAVAVGGVAAAVPGLLDQIQADLLANANELFDVVAKGVVKINVNHTYPLQEAAQAHKDLESRKTTGSIVLLP